MDFINVSRGYYQNGFHTAVSDSETFKYDVFGITGKCETYLDCRADNNPYIGVYNNNSTYDEYAITTTNNKVVNTFNSNSYFSDRIRIRIRDSVSTSSSDSVWVLIVQDSYEQKELKNTQDTQITSPLSNTNLKNNDGIYLAKDNGQDWICFQDDGELHVTVKEGDPKWWYAKSDGTNISEQPITETNQTINIPSSAFKEDHGRYVAKVYFRNAFVKSLTQQLGTSPLNTIESTISPSSSYPLVYSYEKPDGSIETKTATSMILLEQENIMSIYLRHVFRNMLRSSFRNQKQSMI